MIRFVFVFLFILFINSFSFSADLKKGLEAANIKDYDTAYLEWLPLAKKGDPWAQYNIGQMYRQGHGLEQNSIVAFEWYMKAAKQGLSIAQFAVAASYSNADGVKRNYQEAFKWFNLSARQQNLSAQYQIGRIFYYGAGKEKNLILSHMWLNIASFNGSDEASIFLNSISNKLNKIELATARELARECIRKFYIDCNNNSLELEYENKEKEIVSNHFNSDEIKISKKLELSENSLNDIEKSEAISNQKKTNNIEKIKENFKIKQFKVTVSSLSVRSCSSISCGRLRVIPKNYNVTVLEVKNNWARISRYYDALCKKGFSPLIERGNKKCLAENGIISNKLSEWVYLDFIKVIK